MNTEHKLFTDAYISYSVMVLAKFEIDTSANLPHVSNNWTYVKACETFMKTIGNIEKNQLLYTIVWR